MPSSLIDPNVFVTDPKFDPSSSTIAARTSKACQRSGREAEISRLVVRDAFGLNRRRCHDCVATAGGDYALCPSTCGVATHASCLLFVSVQSALQMRVVICDSSSA
jgi:hypothetical protein